jgi:hypothetical protein
MDSIQILQETGASGRPEVTLDLLEKRFSARRPAVEAADIVYEFTNAPALLQQYYTLHLAEYMRAWDARNIPLKDEYDSRCHTLIMRRGKHVVGGVRLILRTPRSRVPLPMEAAGVDLSQALPGINLAYQTYGEVSRMARLPEYRGFEFTMKIHEQLRRKAQALGMRYGFMVAPASNTRLYRLVGQMTQDSYTVLEHVRVPEVDSHEGLRMIASCIDYGVPESAVYPHEADEAVSAPVLPETAGI